MQDFRKRRNTKQDILRAVWGLLGVIALGFVAYFAARGAWGMYGKFAAASQADADAKADLAGLQTQYTQVGAAVASLSSPTGVEAGLRERYGVARPGEGQIDIVEQEPTTTGAAAPEPNIFVKIFRAIFVW